MLGVSIMYGTLYIDHAAHFIINV